MKIYWKKQECHNRRKRSLQYHKHRKHRERERAPQASPIARRSPNRRRRATRSRRCAHRDVAIVITARKRLHSIAFSVQKSVRMRFSTSWKSTFCRLSTDSTPLFSSTVRLEQVMIRNIFLITTVVVGKYRIIICLINELLFVGFILLQTIIF
jgi:hypothetical protein